MIRCNDIIIDLVSRLALISNIKAIYALTWVCQGIMDNEAYLSGSGSNLEFLGAERRAPLRRLARGDPKPWNFMEESPLTRCRVESEIESFCASIVEMSVWHGDFPSLWFPRWSSRALSKSSDPIFQNLEPYMCHPGPEEIEMGASSCLPRTYFPENFIWKFRINFISFFPVPPSKNIDLLCTINL